ncbi:dihydrofolate reductase [Paenibacillus flagellatus]|uniref:Dihydrofolate reductase n=2 Tax=Paenibacillus flagellatus TaxID=2211139 RepID=A0A2V5JZA5_9BACL|nr:dihydrofolate reductase [Paenibacillus flagellatus]
MGRNRVIGRNNDIPWRLPAEQLYFKAVTMGHTVVSGRKNFESMKRPLPGRRNVVMTRDPAFAADGCEIVRSVEDVLERYVQDGRSPLFIIGGEQLYRLFLPLADTIYLTVIDEEFEGDTFFPEFDSALWEETSRRTERRDERNPHDRDYVVYRLRR